MKAFKGKSRKTSSFGMRFHPTKKKYLPHKGEDWVSEENNWTVHEVTGGTVIETSIGYNGGRGNLVRVDIGKGAIETYQHLESIAVKRGQSIKEGDVIGLAGSTGDSTGRHLHFEVTVNGAAVDPTPWLEAEAKPSGKLRLMKLNAEDGIYYAIQALEYSSDTFEAVKAELENNKTPGDILAII